MAERPGLPVAVDNDANCAVLAEGATARRGARRRGDAHARHRDRRRHVFDGEVYRGGPAAGPRWGTWCSTSTGRRARAQLPQQRCLETYVLGHRDRARGPARRPSAPDSALGRRWARAARSRAAHHRDGARRRCAAQVARSRRSAAVSARAGGAREHLQPGDDRHRRRRDRRRASCCSRPRARRSRARAALAARPSVVSSRARFGRDAGLLGAAGWRSGAAPGDGVAGGRLVVCPTPIGNLEDVTLRVLSALREADVVACEDTRTTRCCSTATGSRRARPLPRAQRARAGAAARGADARRRVVALVTDAGMPLVSDPGSCSCGQRGGRAAGRGAAGAVRGVAALVAAGCRRTRGGSSASCRASAGELSGCSRARRRWWRSSLRAGSRRRSPCSAGSTGTAPVAVAGS